MLLDLINQDNYHNYNIRVANIFDLESAIYLQLILNIYQKAITKNKVIEFDNLKYVTLDRAYIKYITTLSEEEQLKIDNKLLETKIIKKFNNNAIYIDIELYISVASNEDSDLIANIQSNYLQKGVKKVSKKDAIKNNLKKYVASQIAGETPEETSLLINLLERWIDALSDNDKCASKQTVDIFINDLFNYTNNIDKAKKIIEIATSCAYREVRWAVKKLEASMNMTTNRVDISSEIKQKKSTKLSTKTY